MKHLVAGPGVCALASMLVAIPLVPPPAGAREASALALGTAPQRIETICRAIAGVRQLDFKHDVQVETQDLVAFRAYVEAGIRKEYGDDMGAGYVRGLVVLGALAHSVELLDEVLLLLEDQAAAHYDPTPGNKRYYILATNAPAAMLDLISSHELCHALQDQHYDLYGMVESDLARTRRNADFGMARQALVEGDATLVMTVWMLMEQLGSHASDMAFSMSSMTLKAQAGMTLSELMTLSETMKDDPVYGGAGMSMASLKDRPRYFVRLLMDAYMQGAVMVDYVRQRGGWEAVDALYRDPPASTEQVLHPEKLVGQRDDPRPVLLPDVGDALPDGWRMLEEDVLGELGMRVMFERLISDVGSADAAAGWGGDRYRLYVSADDDEHFLVWQTLWDSPSDAREFAVAYQAGLRERFDAIVALEQRRADDGRIVQVWQVAPGRWITLVRHADAVRITDTTMKALHKLGVAY